MLYSLPPLGCYTGIQTIQRNDVRRDVNQTISIKIQLGIFLQIKPIILGEQVIGVLFDTVKNKAYRRIVLEALADHLCSWTKQEVDAAGYDKSRCHSGINRDN
ncbi:hypothetical protein C7N83_04060 [Neisseria iguanae]|uniref:Uncharacterized protein n=1 Tax=Neisseria iguanae TaxID=90242 RepID=A0A2P7U1M2_9NEIS|nr:hypothetical protein C7N83_04060 [Neisseria iguanae]